MPSQNALPTRSARPSRLALTILAALAVAPVASAANAAWNVDADGAWSDAANWNPAAAPGDTTGLASTDVANFSKTLTANRTVTVDANRNISGITFSQSSNSSYTLTGGPILLSNGGTIQANNSAGTHTDTIAAPVIIQGDGGTGNFWGNALSNGEIINVTGNVSGVSTAGKTTLLNIFGFNTQSTFLINGVVSDGSNGGKLAIVKGGSGNWRINSANNTYSGGFTINSGSISFGASSTSSNGTVTSGPAGTGTLTFSGGIVQTGGNFSLANPIFVTAFTSTNVRGTGSANITLTGPITGTGTLNNNHTTSSSAIIQGDISGFTGTISHTTITNGNNFTFNGSTPESQNGSSARFVLSGTGGNRSMNIGSSNATTFQMGELSGTGGRIAPNTTGVTLQIGALNTTPASPFAGSITGTLALNKVGTGTLTLSGNNTHTGATTVSAGTLRVTGNLTTSATTVASGAALSGEGTMGGVLSLDGGATLRADSTTAGALTTGGLVLNGTAYLTIDGASSIPATSQTVRALNYAGTISGAGSLTTSGLRNASINTSTAGQIDVTFDTKLLAWSGESAAWDIGTTANWNLGGDTFNQGDVISFDDNAANKNIILTGVVFPAAVTFSNTAGNDYVIGGTGQIGGATTLTKDGTGALTLTGQQIYTGATTLNAGSLTTAGFNGPLTINGGALTVTGSNGLNGANSLTIPAGASVTLSGANNFTGATTNNGTLKLENPRSIASTASLALNNGGILQLRSDSPATFTTPTVALATASNATIDVAPLTTGSSALSLGTVSFTGNGSVSSSLKVTGSGGSSLSLTTVSAVNSSSGNTSINLSLVPTTANLTIDTITATTVTNRDANIILDGTGTGIVTNKFTTSGSGWLYLVKNGTGTWIISGAGGAYAGTTTINDNGGILRIDRLGAFGSNTIRSFKAGTRTGTLQLNIPGTNTLTNPINCSSSSTFAAGGTPTVQNLQGNTTLSGSLSINNSGGSGMNIQSDVGGTLKLTGTLRNIVANSNRLFDLGGAGDGEVSGTIADGTGTAMVTSLTKEGTGTWTISGGNNTYTGTTTVAGGTLVVSGAGTLGTSKIALANDATLDVSGTAAPTFTAPTGLGGNGTLNASGKSVSISGPFTPGALSIAGNVTLSSGNSTFLADSSPATSTAVVVTGTFQNGGTLAIAPAAGFTFATGQNFTFVSATGGIISGYTGVTVNSLPLAADTPGVWKLTDSGLNYTFTESTGTLAVASTVVADTTPPVITLNGSSFVSVNWGSSYSDAGATATDNVDSSVTVNTTGTVNTAKPGVYTLTYNAADVAGNAATPVTRTVTVSIANATTPGADGYSPLMRYALGANSPTDSVQAPVLSSTATTLSLTAVVRTDDSALTVGAEAVTDLAGTWGTGGTINVTTAADQTGVPSGCTRKVFSVDITGAAKKFLRIKATLAP